MCTFVMAVVALRFRPIRQMTTGQSDGCEEKPHGDRNQKCARAPCAFRWSTKMLVINDNMSVGCFMYFQLFFSFFHFENFIVAAFRLSSFYISCFVVFHRCSTEPTHRFNGTNAIMISSRSHRCSGSTTTIHLNTIWTCFPNIDGPIAECVHFGQDRATETRRERRIQTERQTAHQYGFYFYVYILSVIRAHQMNQIAQFDRSDAE